MKVDPSKALKTPGKPTEATRNMASPTPGASPPPAPPAAPAPPSAPEAARVVAESRSHLPEGASELLAFPAWLLGGLPHPVTMQLSMRRPRHVLWVTYDLAEAYPTLRARGAVVLTGAEFDALTCAAESERAGPDIVRWLETKRTSPHWELTQVVTLGGVVANVPRRRWSVDKVLGAWGLTLEHSQVSIGIR